MVLNLEHLEALEIFSESGSFAKAAVRLNKVRSAVSYDIRALEEYLGVTLLDRSGYRAELTPIGTIVVERTQHLLREARAVEHLAKQLSEEWEPTLQLVIEGAIPIQPVMRVIQKLNADNIPTRFELKTEFLSGVPQRFEQEGADLMLVKDFEAPRDEYEVCELPSVHCFLVAHRDHAIFRTDPSKVGLDLLCDHVELNIQVSDPNSVLMNDKRIGSPRVLNLSDFHTKKEALLLGLGFGWMPGALIGEELADGRLKVIPFDQGEAFQFTPSLMHKKERPLGRTGQLFRTLLVEEFQSIERDFDGGVPRREA